MNKCMLSTQFFNISNNQELNPKPELKENSWKNRIVWRVDCIDAGLLTTISDLMLVYLLQYQICLSGKLVFTEK